MTGKKPKLQPGAILHEAIVGAFRVSGDNFNAWCLRNDITPSVARNATFGQSRGPAGQKLLGRLIEAAGADFVEQAYERRLVDHAAEFGGVAKKNATSKGRAA
ncbi:hypothetical protein [Thalassovita sp.]|uniref:hypothetical protein n=1 Tax=Thalassovita sp. TaxID=1979401 RepID=UPI002B27719E|nr:hypothetical protein [Thalassovita sp.]